MKVKFLIENEIQKSQLILTKDINSINLLNHPLGKKEIESDKVYWESSYLVDGKPGLAVISFEQVRSRFYFYVAYSWSSQEYARGNRYPDRVWRNRISLASFNKDENKIKDVFSNNEFSSVEIENDLKAKRDTSMKARNVIKRLGTYPVEKWNDKLRELI